MTEKQRQLATENHSLIYSFLRKHHYDQEDYYDLAAIGLCKAAKHYNESMGTFSTLAYKCMLNEIRKYLTVQGAARRIPENLIKHYDIRDRYDKDDEFIWDLDRINFHESFENDAIINTTIDIYKVKLTDKDRTVFEMLMDGYTTREIGKVVGCSSTTVTTTRRKFENPLRRMLI